MDWLLDHWVRVVGVWFLFSILLAALWIVLMSFRESEEEYLARRRREKIARQDARMKAIVEEYTRRENAKRVDLIITQLHAEAGGRA